MIKLGLLCAVLLYRITAGSSIAGGRDAHAGSWPWMAAIQIKSNPGGIYCGGSILNKRWVLTAARCLCHPMQEYIVRLGVDRLSETSPNEATYRIDEVAVPPGYPDPDADGDDIAVARLDRDIVFGKFVKPVQELALPGDVFHRNCSIAGWGMVQDNVALRHPQALQVALVPLIESGVCRRSYPGLRESMVCAGATGRGSCQGDSGGPLLCCSGIAMVQVGVASYREGCGKADYPGVYTRVSSFRDFITTHTHHPAPELN